MPASMIAIDYAHTLVNTVGQSHGLTIEEIKRGEGELAALVKRIQCSNSART